MLYLGNVRAGFKLYSNCLHNIMSSPLSFFDMTPVGRIMNRFGKDLDVVDSQMSINIHGWLYCVLRVITVPAIMLTALHGLQQFLFLWECLTLLHRLVL